MQRYWLEALLAGVAMGRLVLYVRALVSRGWHKETTLLWRLSPLNRTWEVWL